MQNMTDQSLYVTVLSKGSRLDPWDINYFMTELFARAWVEGQLVRRQFIVMIDANGNKIN